MKFKTLSKAGYFRRFQTFAMNRMVPFSATDKDGLSYWRARILFAIIFSAVLIGSVALGPTIAMLVKEKIWGLLIFDIVIYLIGIGLLFSRRPRYEIRASIVLLIFYAVGLVVIITVGPLSGGPAWLFAFAVLSGVLLGSKTVIMALTVNAATLTTIGLLINEGLFGQSFPFFNTMEVMIAAGVNFMLLNTIAAISVAVLVKGLVLAHQKESDLIITLERERSHLINTKKELELEVAERKQAEEELRESEIKFRDLMESLPVGVIVSSPEGQVLEANLTTLKIFGYDSKEEYLKIPASASYYDKKERERFVELHKEGLAKDFETQFIRKDGTVFWGTLTSLSQITATGATQYFNVFQDITERKRAEKALRESDGRYRNILESIEEGYFEVDIAGNFTFFNNSLCKILGYPKDEMMGMNNRQYADKENTKKLYETFNKVYKTGKPEKGFDWEIIRKDGTKRYIEASVSLLKDAGDKPIGFRGIVRDVTERKRAEEALRESEGKYRNIFENIQDVYYETTLEGIILEISPSIENVSKYKRKELIGKSVYDLYTNPEEREELLKAVLVSGKVDNFEVHLTDKDGSQHSFEINVTLHRDKNGNPIKLFGSMRDISERKRLEAGLRQSQKMETVGALAGGIAHEFNNILGTIIGNTELAIGDVPEGNPARDCLKEIQTASLRAKDVVRQILGFAGKSVFQLMPVQISPIIRDAMLLIRASIPATIEIRENISCESDMVMADPTQINQVLTNLCINAKNAMQEKGGVLEVKLENTSLDETSATRYEDLSPGNYVKLTVKDSGHGIDPKKIDRIFDPYFTTTSLAEGTGMGLAVVHGIVKHHNGAITVASEPGKGTFFKVLFPLTEAEAEQEAGEQEALPTGNEKILFVDDEASLVKMAKRMLEMQGYQVEAKSDPVEALELFRSKPDRFDLIITDMTMPKMTGDKLAKEILSIRPDMPIILCSGFSEKIDAEKAKELGISKYIEKPLYMSDFVVTVREVLDRIN